MKSPHASAFLTSALIVTAVVAGEGMDNAVSLSPSNATHANSSIGITSNLVTTCTTARNVDWGGQSAEERGDPAYCCRRCLEEPSCITYTWTDYQGGTCWLKAYLIRTSLVSKLGAISCVLSGPNEPSMFQVQTNCDLPGYDYLNANIKSNDVASCNKRCLADAGCKAVTWTDYQGGTCWFKNGVAGCVYKQGATSSVKFAQA